MSTHTVRVHGERNPHYYVAPDPTARLAYSGCQMCGYGPGTFLHNAFEVDKYLLARLLGLNYRPGEELT